MFLKYRRLISFCCQIVGCGKTCRSRADNGDLLLPLGQSVGCDHHRRNISGLLMQIQLCNKLLNCVNCYGFIHRTAGTGCLTPPVADTSADCRERIVLLDQCQRFLVFPFLCFTDVTLNRNVGRTGRLTGRSTGLIAVDPVIVTVILVVFILSPYQLIRKLMFRIFHLCAILPAQLLAQLHRSCRTVFHTLAAGDTFIFFHLRRKCAPAHIRRVKQLRGTECITDIYVTVTDTKDLILSVYIGDLMDKSVILCLAEDLHSLLVCNIMAFACLPAVIGKITDAYTPVHLIIRASILKDPTAHTAGTLSHADMPFILLQPVRNMLQVERPRLHLNRLFHRNYMHTDPGASRRHHMGNPIQRDKGHALKKACQRRMFLQAYISLRGFFHIKQFRRTRHEHRQAVSAVRRSRNRTVMVIVIAIVILQKPNVAHLIQKLLELLFIFLRHIIHLP